MHTTSLGKTAPDHVWRTRYQWSDNGRLPEPSMEATWDRVALAVSAAEPRHRDEWRERFRSILGGFRFVPGGRILANAGTPRQAAMSNCFVMGPLEDSVQGIFNTLRETMLTLQAGGGVGLDFSPLRPAGAAAVSRGRVASGPVSFMKIWDAANAVMESGNPRRGAMVASLRCDHPDIESFIDAKVANRALQHFRLSVVVSDDFMRAVEEDGPWALVFPLNQHPVPAGGEVCERVWSADAAPQLCQVHRRMPARTLWDKLLAAEHACGEPDVVFVDRINRDNNLWYCERIATTDPGGGVPLAPGGACNLGSINLTRFVQNPFTQHPRMDFGELRAVAAIATRFLDNVHDLAWFPLKSQEKMARSNRRIGLGVTGLADTFAMLGLRYASPGSIDLARELMGVIRDTAYRTSIELAREKGAFPEFDKIKYGASPFVLNLSHDLQDAIAQHGMRNSHLLAVAPTDATSLLANNVSRGIEPIAAYKSVRGLRGADGVMVTFEVEDAAARHFAQLHGPHAALPAHFVQAADVDAQDQLRLMAAIQSCVDNAISATVRLPQSASAQDMEAVLRRAWELGLKGCALARQDKLFDH